MGRHNGVNGDHRHAAAGCHVGVGRHGAIGCHGGAPGASCWGDKAADKKALDVYGRNDAKKDPGSLFSITDAIGARTMWLTRDSSGRPVTGRGVTVAVVDSGVAAVPGLDAPGKIVRGPDLSIEANSAQAWATTRSGTARTWPASSRPGTLPRWTRRPEP